MNKVLILPLAAALAAPAYAVTFQRWQTADGATVTYAERRELPIVHMEIVFKGAGQTGESVKGAAAMTADMLTSGSEQYSEEELYDRSNRLGITIGSSAGTENASVSFASLSRRDTLSDGLKLANQIIAHPKFDEKILEREKTQAVTALRQSLSNPSFLASRALTILNYGNHAYADTARLNEADIAAVTTDALKAHHRSTYAKNNAYVAIVGDVSRKEADEMATAVLDGLPAQADIRPIADIPQTDGRQQDIPFADKEQAVVVMGLPLLVHKDPDRYALTVGNYILGGGGFDSRLMKTLRDEKGLVYGVSSSLSPLEKKGPFAVSFSTKKGSAAEALAAARSVLENFIAQGPTEAELKQAKDNIVGSFPMSFDTNAKTVGLAAAVGVRGLPLDYYDNYTRNIEAVTAEQIKEVWQRRLDPKKMNVVTVGKETR